MYITGKIIDADTQEGISGATVELWTGDIMLKRLAANDQGIFTAIISSTPDKITVSSASYADKSFPLIDPLKAAFFALQKEIVENEGVFVTTKKPAGMSWLLWLLIIAGVVIISNQKSR